MMGKSPPSIFLLCIYLRGINTNLFALCWVDNVKLKVALPRTRPHMCNGNVAPKRTRSPDKPTSMGRKVDFISRSSRCGYVNWRNHKAKNKDALTREYHLDSRRKTSQQVFRTCSISISRHNCRWLASQMTWKPKQWRFFLYFSIFFLCISLIGVTDNIVVHKL